MQNKYNFLFNLTINERKLLNFKQKIEMQVNRKKILNASKVLILVFSLWILTHSVFITTDRLSDNYTKSDVAIVLGSKVNENGIASERLKARLDVAFKLYINDVVENILVSGEIGFRKSNNCSCPIFRMARFLFNFTRISCLLFVFTKIQIIE